MNKPKPAPEIVAAVVGTLKWRVAVQRAREAFTMARTAYGRKRARQRLAELGASTEGTARQ